MDRPLGLLILFLLLASPLQAREFAWSGPQQVVFQPGHPPPVVGRNIPYRLGPEDTFIELARRSGVGFQALAAANPGMDPWLPPPGENVLIPYETILPSSITEPGIVINLAEHRLYYLWEVRGELRVLIYPVGIGIEGRDTPERSFTVKAKIKNPSWTAPPSIRQERPEDPVYIPPGPDNPLGEYWIELGDGYGIHGTNRPFGVGRRVSQGCLRLYPEHIRDLFHRVERGTPVRIVYQPVKLGRRGEELVVEVHRDYDNRLENPQKTALVLQETLPWNDAVNLSALVQAITERRGIPVSVSDPLSTEN